MFALRRSIRASLVAIALAAFAGGETAADDAPVAAPTSYEGHPVAWWIEVYVAGRGTPGSLGKAYNALVAFGDAAMPGLSEVILGDDLERRARAAGFVAASPRSPTALVETLRGRLRGADPAARIAAAGVLARLGGKAAPAAEDLGRLLADEDVRVRQAAMFALEAVGSGAEAALLSLVAAIDDADWRVRVGAVSVIGLLGQKGASAAPALIARFGRGDVAFDRGLVLTLGSVGAGRPEVIAFLRSALSAEDAWTRAHAVGGLSRCAGPDAVAEESAAFARDPAVEVRLAAVAALGAATRSPRWALPVLVRGVEDPDQRIRFEAQVDVLAFGDAAAEAVPGLLRSLRDHGAENALTSLARLARWSAAPLADAFPTLPAETRRDVAGSLHLFDRDVLDPLLPRFVSLLSADLLDASLSRPHRGQVSYTLGEYARTRADAVVALAEAARSPDVEVAAAGLGSLRAAMGRGDAVERVLASGESRARRALLPVLAALDPKRVLFEPHVADCLTDADPEVRRLAAFLLLAREPLRPAGSAYRGASLRFDPQLLHDAVLPALSSGDAGTRATAARCLGLVPEASAGEMLLLVEFLTDRDRGVAKASAIALASIARVVNVSVLDLVRGTLGGELPARLAAALALAEAGGYHVVVIPVVLPALSDADPAARLAACEAAAALGRDGKALAEALEPLVHDADPAVATAAAEALRGVRLEPSGRAVPR